MIPSSIINEAVNLILKVTAEFYENNRSRVGSFRGCKPHCNRSLRIAMLAALMQAELIQARHCIANGETKKTIDDLKNSMHAIVFGEEHAAKENLN